MCWLNLLFVVISVKTPHVPHPKGCLRHRLCDVILIVHKELERDHKQPDIQQLCPFFVSSLKRGVRSAAI